MLSKNALVEDAVSKKRIWPRLKLTPAAIFKVGPATRSGRFRWRSRFAETAKAFKNPFFDHTNPSLEKCDAEKELSQTEEGFRRVMLEISLLLNPRAPS